MIAAIADDLTGATEIAGLGWRHGLSADVLHRDETATGADLVVYDSDSRLCRPAEARRRVKQIVRRLEPQRPEWIFKKVDSVLRGNVLAEVEALLKLLRLPRCILAPANPTGGRVIRRGRYFIQGRPIDRTDFRRDPHHPRRSSRVLELLGLLRSDSCVCRALPGTLPQRGIIIAEAATFRDVLRWGHAVDELSLPAGGGDFFRALLLARGFRPRAASRCASMRPDIRQALAGARAASRSERRTLFVSGSPAESALEFLERCRRRGWPVLLLPEELLDRDRRRLACQNAWARQIVAAVQEHPRVVVGIGRPVLPGPETPHQLGAVLIGTVARVLRQATPDCLCIEGGATAALLMRELHWTRLRVEDEFARGVTAVHPHVAPRLRLVLKPGSYSWPEELVG